MYPKAKKKLKNVLLLTNARSDQYNLLVVNFPWMHIQFCICDMTWMVHQRISIKINVVCWGNPIDFLDIMLSIKIRINWMCTITTFFGQVFGGKVVIFIVLQYTKITIRILEFFKSSNLQCSLMSKAHFREPNTYI